MAKFTYYKDREFIRTHAAQKLKGSNVRVNEQYHPEIEERRKSSTLSFVRPRKRKKNAQSWSAMSCTLRERFTLHLWNPPVKLHLRDRLDQAMRVNRHPDVTDSQTKDNAKDQLLLVDRDPRENRLRRVILSFFP